MGFNLPEDRVPISPAFHYSMGGIKCDIDAKVKNFKNLYVIGEVANTRVHGANRLASNSLLEGLVFSIRAVKNILNNHRNFIPSKFDEKEEILFKDGDKVLKNELRKLMWNKVGIIREKKELNEALSRVEDMLCQNIGKLLRLRLLTSKQIITSTLKREKSLGAHYIKE